MKKAFLITAVFLFGYIYVSAQRGVFKNVYAWAQPVLGGARPAGNAVEGGGELKTSVASKLNYFLYAEYKLSSRKIGWMGVWINGVHYSVQAVPVTDTPVKPFENGLGLSEKKWELVPATSNPVMQLLPEKSSGKAVPKVPAIRRMIRDNELVIVYIYMGKTWYYPVPKIKMMDAVPAS